MIRKTLSFVFALALLFGTSVSAFAQETPLDSQKKISNDLRISILEKTLACAKMQAGDLKLSCMKERNALMKEWQNSKRAEHNLDTDKDGVPDFRDAFPTDPNEWKDTDHDGIGDEADPDDNGNGIPDSDEKQLSDTDKDGVPDAFDKMPRDHDNDGKNDNVDKMPNDSNNDGQNDE